MTITIKIISTDTIEEFNAVSQQFPDLMQGFTVEQAAEATEVEAPSPEPIVIETTPKPRVTRNMLSAEQKGYLAYLFDMYRNEHSDQELADAVGQNLKPLKQSWLGEFNSSVTAGINLSERSRCRKALTHYIFLLKQVISSPRFPNDACKAARLLKLLAGTGVKV